MKLHDVLTLADESPKFLRVADSLADLKEADMRLVNICSKSIIQSHQEDRSKIFSFLATSSFVSIASLFRGLLREDPEAVYSFIGAISESDMQTPAGKILSEKIRMFYTFRLISNTFDDQNLLKLKKALNNND
jgi:hypothetical protein